MRREPCEDSILFSSKPLTSDLSPRPLRWQMTRCSGLSPERPQANCSISDVKIRFPPSGRLLVRCSVRPSLADSASPPAPPLGDSQRTRRRGLTTSSIHRRFSSRLLLYPPVRIGARRWPVGEGGRCPSARFHEVESRGDARASTASSGPMRLHEPPRLVGADRQHGPGRSGRGGVRSGEAVEERRVARVVDGALGRTTKPPL
jgi:hypothetical protein